MQRLAVALRRNYVGIAVLVTLVAGWEIMAHLAPKSPLRESPIVPPWEFVFGRSLVGLSDYWKFDRWAPVPQMGGARTLTGATLAIVYHSALTLYRLCAGFGVGLVSGVFLGLALSWSRTVRSLLAPSLHFIRMCPLLALVPLFQFWFGATDRSAIAFVAYGVGVICLVGTLSAVENVPKMYLESAKVLGAGKFQIYREIILPAILPSLFSSIYIALGVSWGAAISAEYVGVDNGIGRMIIWSEYFTNTGRMTLITIIIVIYAYLSALMFRALQHRLLRWMPANRDAVPRPS